VKPNAFIGRTVAPSDRDLAEALGPAKAHWDAVVVDMAQDLGCVDHEWKSYGATHGWSLRLKRGKRNIVHLSPCHVSFAVLLILGDRAVTAARASRLGVRATALLDAAPRYPEGTGIRLEVTSARNLPLVRKLAKIKLQN
jgi:hypothetical protein